MTRFLKDYRLHEHTEALFLLVLGIIIQTLDGSPFDVWGRWRLAWETEFPREHFSMFAEQIIKAALSIIILGRCVSTIPYVLFGLIAIYCILKEASSKLMLPFLLMSGLKSVLMTFVETLIGVYVCSAFGKVRKACIEFIISKAIELFFSIYLWFCIRGIHKDFQLFEENYREEELLTEMVVHKVKLRRRRARSMIDQSTLYRTTALNYFSMRNVPNIIFDMLKTEDELSQDSLLSPGMMLASVSNMGSYEYLKTSLSTGELGVTDLDTFLVSGLDDTRNLSPTERAMKFLKLTGEDIKKAKERTRSETFALNYRVSMDVPESVTMAKPITTFHRPFRQKEIYAAKLPELDKVLEHLNLKKKRRSNMDSVSGMNLTFSQVDIKQSLEQIVKLEDDEDKEEDEDELEEVDDSKSTNAEYDGELTPNMWYMSNVKDRVSRIGLVNKVHSKTSHNYEKLYKRDYMNKIGPEVFDKANKLKTLTSLCDESKTESGWLYPCSSRDPEVEDSLLSGSEVDSDKPVKSKKIKFDKPTAMPISVIVRNFPIKFDSKIPESEAIYLREAESSQVELMSDRSVDYSTEIWDAESAVSKTKGKQSDQLGTEPDDKLSDGRIVHDSDPSNGKDIDLMILKYPEDVKTFDNTGRPWRSGLCTGRDLISNHDLMAFGRGEKMNNGYHYCNNYSRESEQMSFIRELMGKPLKDVLRYYYHLREMKDGNFELRKSRSMESLGEEFDDAESESQKEVETPLTSLSDSEGKTFVDREIQVSLCETGLKNAGVVATESSQAKTFEAGNEEQLKCGDDPSRTENGQSSRVNNDVGNVRRSLQCIAEESPENNVTDESDSSIICGIITPTSESTVENSSSSLEEEKGSPSAAEDHPIVYNAESNESFSLFYSKNADLASPLLDMRRFIYLDHIHYSFKNMKKKGFDVELNRELPLLVRDSLTLNSSVNVKKMNPPPDPQTGITRRPMDLTFANKEAFNSGERSDPSQGKVGRSESDHFYNSKLLSSLLLKALEEEQLEIKSESGEDSPSSIDLHSNKGRVEAAVLENTNQKKM